MSVNDSNPVIPHLQNFWNLISLKRIPTTPEDLRVLIQVEMMKHCTRTAICRMTNNQIEKYLTRLFVKDTQYFCNRSKYLIKDLTLRTLVDMIVAENLEWHIESNLEGTNYLFASWNHWNI